MAAAAAAAAAADRFGLVFSGDPHHTDRRKIGDDFHQTLLLYINGQPRHLREVQPDLTLLEYLRNNRQQRLTGTKLGCGEGGCGACTVMVSHFETPSQRSRNSSTSSATTKKNIVHRAVNACLAPLASLDGCHITTVEGIGSTKTGLHPVQQRIADFHGAQCGFCTPGIVMALYAFFQNHPNATRRHIEEALDGNLCRCTGYRPILDAAKSLASDNDSCSKACACADHKLQKKTNNGTNMVDMEHDGVLYTTLNTCSCSKTKNLPPLAAAIKQHSSNAAKFPDELRNYTLRSLRFENDLCSWFQPSSYMQLLALKRRYPRARLVVGNTEVGIETKFKRMNHKVRIGVARMPELRRLSVVTDETDKGSTTTTALEVGGSVTITELRNFLNTFKEQKHTKKNDGLRRLVNAFLKQIRWFSSTQIRNVACVAGNIITASPIADLNPLLQAVGGQIVLARLADDQTISRRVVSMQDFFLRYRTVDLEPSEVLEAVRIPLPNVAATTAAGKKKLEFLESYKQARRREDDISIVSAGMHVVLTKQAQPQGFVVQSARFSFGGMAPTTKLATATAGFLKGRVWSRETIMEAMRVLNKDLPVPENTPGGMEEYRSTLAASFLFKFYIFVCKELGGSGNKSAPSLPHSWESAATEFERGISSGRQMYQVSKDPPAEEKSGGRKGEKKRGTSPVVVAKPIRHVAGEAHVTGEAIYTDDIPDPAETLHACIVLTKIPRGTIKAVDTSDAAREPGFVDFVSAGDVHGQNTVGEILHDEELFVSRHVVTASQAVGLVIATSQLAAERAAHAVKVEYERHPNPILSIAEAIEAKSFHEGLGAQHTITCGNVEAVLKSDGTTVLEGEASVGGQEHFYLETNNVLVIPHELGEVEVIQSTQNPNATQEQVARVLDAPCNKVVVRVKRLGGGFGGKETRGLNIACYAAVAATKLGKPVRLSLTRNVDMMVTGGRHPFFAKYRVGFASDGTLRALDAQLYNNGGYSMDLSMPVMDRALFHIDNVYKWGALRVVGRVCKTNLPSNTAFRGFGGPQGMMVTEMIIERVARHLNMTTEAIREKNFYKSGDKTHFGQVLERCTASQCYAQLKEIIDFDAAAAEVQAFNAESRFRKRGISLIPTKFGIAFTALHLNQGAALVQIYRDGTVLLTHGGTEMGQGLHTKMCQVAAQAFGVDINMVHVAETATDKVANASATAASFSSDINGFAVLDACSKINKRLAPLRKSKPDLAWPALCHHAYMERVDLAAHGFHKVPGIGYSFETGEGTPFRYFTYGAAVSVVEIDTLTGDLQILSSDVLMDLGMSLNPVLDVGQIEGAFAQGVGLFTMEELVWGDKAHSWLRPGMLLTQGPGAYKLPGFNDVPIRFNIHLLRDSPNPRGVHSSKAVGEPPLFMASSVFFAIKEALRAARIENQLGGGYFQLNSPATSERIRMASFDVLTAPFAEAATFQPKGCW